MKKIKDYFIISAGAVIYALSVVIFTSPNNIAPGGLTGIATVLNYLFSAPIGTLMLIMNVPLFFIGAKAIGTHFLGKSLLGTVVVSLAIDLLMPFVPAYKGDMMLACIFGGILNGTGLALIFTRGGTTGGTDIIATLIHRKIPHISMGYIILLSDAIIITIAALVYGSIESALYAVIAIFVSTKLIDIIIYGTSRNNGKMMLIITKKHEEILHGLLNKVSRGVTVVDAKGGYSGEDIKLLICALRPQQVFTANEITRKIDSNSFIIVTTAGSINGAGFVNN